MKGWRFALSRQWIGYFALTVAFAIACSALGVWQFARRAEARAEIQRVESNYGLDPRPIAEVAPDLDGFDQSTKWTPVLLAGEYLRDEQVLVRNRPLAGKPGFEVLTPILLEDGRVFVVNRGWLPMGNENDAPDEVPEAPGGPVLVEARLVPGEPEYANRTAPDGQVATIHLPGIAASVGLPTYTGAYGLLSTEDPSPAVRPIVEAKPDPDEGPHLSYALQWFVFAILGFVGFGYLVRQEYRALNADDPVQKDRERSRRLKASQQGPGDDDVEDAAIDAAAARQASEISSA